jgi:hypothetical protein
MAVTVSGTSITFNDATVQTTAAGAPTISYGTNYVPIGGFLGNAANTATLSTSYQKVATSRVFLSGTVNVLCGVLNGNNGASITTTIYLRAYINGTAVGTEASVTLATNIGANLTLTNIPVSTGDLLQIYAKASNTNFSFLAGGNYGLYYGVSSNLSVPAISDFTSGFPTGI